VIKVEPPAGDETRGYGPPFVGTESTYYLNLNRNKRGVALDLTQPAGQDVVRRLVMSSDVLVENFKTGTMERWGLGPDALCALNPRLIYCGISGFGRDGPYAQVPGYDAVVQAMAGFMSLNGEADSPPLKAGIPIADLITGIFASQAVLLALARRHTTGSGQQVSVSLLESLLSVLHPQIGATLNAGVTPGRVGNSHPSISPYDVLPTADRPIYLTVGNNGQFRRLVEALDRPDLADDARFGSNADRVRHRSALLEELGHAFARKPAAEWCRQLWEAGVPAGPVNTLPEALADPQVQYRQVVQEIACGRIPAGVFRSVVPPAHLEESPGSVRRAPPGFGEHTVEVLVELGYTHNDIADVLRSGAAMSGESRGEAC
jgi:formyl-CoA transferase